MSTSEVLRSGERESTMGHEADELRSVTCDERDGQLLVENRLRGKTLSILIKSFVKPDSETPSDKRWLSLSNLDKNWLPFYTPLICIYKETPAGSDAGEHLRESLGKALTLFYPLAGRVVTSGDEGPRIHCNDAGAVFVEASIDADLEELRYGDFQPLFLLSGMAEAGLGAYPQLPEDAAGRPALIVQMTHFKCGGITLASNWAHSVADGVSGFHFMKSWAELARGEDVSFLPVHARHLVCPRNPLVLSNPFPGINSELSNGTGHSHGTENRSEGKPEEKQITTPTVHVIEITKQDVNDLKREAESGASDETSRLSRVCVVSAHLWRALVKARNLPGSDLTRFWILVEGRKQMSLPEGYFGNAVGGRYATTTVSNLLDKPLAYSARLVLATIQHATTDWYQDLVDWVEAKKGKEYPGLVLGPDHECGSSWQNRFPYYDLNFGFGSPVCAMRNANSAWDGCFAILPSYESPENYTAMVHMPPNVMKRFLPLLQKNSNSS